MFDTRFRTAAHYFATPSAPTPAMVAWAVTFILAALLFAVRQFDRRPL